jgi:hypothetical protein
MSSDRRSFDTKSFDTGICIQGRRTNEEIGRTNRERAWKHAIDGLTDLWIALLCVSLAVDFGVFSLASGHAAVDRFLRVAVVAFLADVCLLYWRSEKGAVDFTRSNPVLVLTVVPWFRPLRAPGRPRSAMHCVRSPARGGSDRCSKNYVVR